MFVFTLSSQEQPKTTPASNRLDFVCLPHLILYRHIGATSESLQAYEKKEARWFLFAAISHKNKEQLADRGLRQQPFKSKLKGLN